MFQCIRDGHHICYVGDWSASYLLPSSIWCPDISACWRIFSVLATPACLSPSANAASPWPSAAPPARGPCSGSGLECPGTLPSCRSVAGESALSAVPGGRAPSRRSGRPNPPIPPSAGFRRHGSGRPTGIPRPARRQTPPRRWG